jgi:hypothetical protein
VAGSHIVQRQASSAVIIGYAGVSVVAARFNIGLLEKRRKQVKQAFFGGLISIIKFFCR